ncbi:MAG: hypothetical protein C4586_05240 [Anaerolineaceae bacterium]|nr:MAG: hypothetical protein C4586_05240 [Anaerolineaceae bacterium]
MVSKAEKRLELLEQMRKSKSNWKKEDIERLYREFGFIMRHGSNHDIVLHPEFPMLRATLARHKALPKGYVQFAVKLIDRLLELQKGSIDE